jgi:hypothetical protein
MTDVRELSASIIDRGGRACGNATLTRDQLRLKSPRSVDCMRGVSAAQSPPTG